MADCQNCTEECPQAERAHETALGRMYVTQEFVRLIKMIEAGQLVEVIRCKNCGKEQQCKNAQYLGEDGYCSCGERKEE